MRKIFIFLAVVLCVIAIIILSRSRKDEGLDAPNPNKATRTGQDRPAPALRPKEYFLQVANCFHESCKDMYVELLRKEREPFVQELIPVTKNVYKLVSQEMRGFERLNEVIDKIGDVYKSLDMSFVSREEAYKLYIGNFSDLNKAKIFKARLEKLFPGKDLTLEPKSSRMGHTVSKIMAGPYSSRDEANMVLKRLKNTKQFRGAFLIYF